MKIIIKTTESDNTIITRTEQIKSRDGSEIRKPIVVGSARHLHSTQ
jgi:hypothetical protein